jgi:hypothetical protein
VQPGFERVRRVKGIGLTGGVLGLTTQAYSGWRANPISAGKSSRTWTVSQQRRRSQVPLAIDLQHRIQASTRREKECGKPLTERKAPGLLVEGQVVTNWKQALEHLAFA